jgi:prolipoprotein diacylglyceryl transferase
LLEIVLPFRKIEGETALFGLVKGWKFTGFTGLASHGAAIAIIIAMFLYSKNVLKRDVLFILDRLAIMVPLAGFFIRFGNFFNSEIYGKEASYGVVFKAVGETVARHPTQLYEAFSYLILFFVLSRMYWTTDKKEKLGYLFGAFMVALWSIRFLIEFLKEPQVGARAEWILNTGQLLSIPMILIGFWLLARPQQLNSLNK